MRICSFTRVPSESFGRRGGVLVTGGLAMGQSPLLIKVSDIHKPKPQGFQGVCGHLTVISNMP